jgi:hypothetical protein
MLVGGCEKVLKQKAAPAAQPAATASVVPSPAPSASPSPPPTIFSASDPSRCGDPPSDETKLGRSHDGKSIVWDAGGRLCFERNGQRKALLVDRDSRGDAGVEGQLSGYDGFVFSRDDRVVFFSTQAWATSQAAHGVEVATGKEWFIVDGAILEELDRGPYMGSLLGEHYRLDDQHEIGSPGYTGRGVVYTIVDWRGKTLKRLPDDENARTKILYGK